MNLVVQHFTKNLCYINNWIKYPKPRKVRGIMVHSTGAVNKSLGRYVPNLDGTLAPNKYANHWNQLRPGGRSVCVHGFIGARADGSVATYETLPLECIGWHSGVGRDGSANTLGYIGFEICEGRTDDADYFWKAYREAVEYCAHVCKQHGLTEKNIISHAEGHKRGIASNHSDTASYFRHFGASMDQFRADVRQLLGAPITETVSPAVKPPEPPALIDTFLVRVQVASLNRRSTPTAERDDNILGQIKDFGTYTIVETRGDWGRLKSAGAGWINLNYTQRRTGIPAASAPSGGGSAPKPKPAATKPAPAKTKPAPKLGERKRTIKSTVALQRTQPSTKKGVVTHRLYKGETYTFKGYVVGQRVEGISTWLVGKNSGEYVWSGNFTDTSVEGLPRLDK